MDTSDIHGRINLIVAYTYLGEKFKARAVVEEALEIDPSNLQLQGLRALVLLNQESSVDMLQRVAEILAVLCENEATPNNIIFNFARLLLDRGRNGTAIHYLRRLKLNLAELPAVYADFVCRELASVDPCGPVEPETVSARPNIEMPLPVGTDVDSAEARERLKDWNHMQTKVGPLDIDIFSHDSGNSILAINSRVEMLSLRPHDNTDIKSLEKTAGRPKLILPVTSGTLWSYGSADWSALVRHGIIEKVWVAR